MEISVSQSGFSHRRRSFADRIDALSYGLCAHPHWRRKISTSMGMKSVVHVPSLRMYFWRTNICLCIIFIIVRFIKWILWNCGEWFVSIHWLIWMFGFYLSSVQLVYFCQFFEIINFNLIKWLFKSYLIIAWVKKCRKDFIFV